MALTKVTGQVIKNTTDVTVGVLTVTNTLAVGGTVSIGGTLTYEDVTNVDAVGLITARNGIVVGSGITLSKDGDGFFTGIVTATSFAGDGSALTGVASTDNIRTNTNATFLQNINVSGSTTTGSLVSSGAISGTTGTFTGDVDIADKIIHTGDTNTAIRFPLDDTVTIETGGSQRFRVDSSGTIHTTQINSAIGAIIKNTAHDSQLQILATASNKNSVIFFGDDADDDIGQIDYDHNNNSLAFVVNTSERLRIDSSGRMLIGTTTEGNSSADDLTIATSSDTGITIRSGTSSGGNIYFSDGTSGADEYRGVISYDHASNFMQFYVNASEAFRVESNTRVLVGHTDNIIVGGHLARLQISGTDYNQSTVSIMANSNDANGAYLMLGHQRSGSAGGTTILNDDDEVGVIRFAACDGSDLAHPTAEIKSYVDGTPGANDMPGRLAFFTTADGGTSKLERMRIDSSGNITAPYQPAFSMYINNNQLSASYNTGTQTMPFGETNTNIGGHFKTSGTDQYKFVAPVAGQYFFAVSQNHTARVDTRIMKNSDTFHGGENEIPSSQTDSAWHHHTLTCVMTLAVGDKVYCTTNNQDGNPLRAWNGGTWDNFSGYLIG